MKIKISQEDRELMIKKRNIAKVDRGLATLTTTSPLTLAESKLVFSIIAQIDLDDEDFKEYKINATELHNEIKNELNAEAKKRSKLKNKDLKVSDVAKDKSSQLEIFCKNFRAKTLNLPVENQLDFDIVGWFDRFNYKSDEDVINCQFHPELKPYLLDFKNNHFKKIHTSSIFQFKSKYTHKFYMLLKTQNLDNSYVSVEDYGHIVPLQWFRRWLGLDVDEYKRYNDLKRRIFEKAQEDLKDFSEVTFTYEEIKKGRAVTHLRIKTKYKKNETPTLEMWEDLEDEAEYSDTLEYLKVNPAYKHLLIDKKVYYVKDIIINSSKKYEIITDRENIKLTHKNIKKLKEYLITFSNAYKFN